MSIAQFFHLQRRLENIYLVDKSLQIRPFGQGKVSGQKCKIVCWFIDLVGL
jgi:hypothetical protein